jgi:16S rRNA processing protein RimM
MIAVGRISKSVGIKGELKVVPLTDDPHRFSRLTTVWIGRDEETSERCTISSVRISEGGVLLKLKEVGSRTDAERRRNSFVFIPEKDASGPSKGSYYIHEIIGMEVSTDRGEALGRVRDVLKLPGNDVWVVLCGKREILIPVTKEIIASVDVEGRAIVIHPIEGLLD